MWSDMPGYAQSADEGQITFFSATSGVIVLFFCKQLDIYGNLKLVVSFYLDVVKHAQAYPTCRLRLNNPYLCNEAEWFY